MTLDGALLFGRFAFPPNQYASTTRGSKGSAIPLAWAIRQR